MIKNLTEKQKLISVFVIGFVIGLIFFKNGFYVPVNSNKGVVIVNKFTGNSCIVRYNKCIRVEKYNND